MYLGRIWLTHLGRMRDYRFVSDEKEQQRLGKTIYHL
jgi:hypothetical protein